MEGLKENQKVFGLGLSRTGTTSLGRALNILGIKTIHYPCDKKTYEPAKLKARNRGFLPGQRKQRAGGSKKYDGRENFKP